MKRLLLLCIVFSLPAFVPPPKPPKGRALPTFGQIVEHGEAKQQMRLDSLSGLPTELKQEILRINTNYGSNISAIAREILNTAAINRSFRSAINNLPNMLIILNSLPRSAAIYLVEKLAQMPVIQNNMLALLQSLPKADAKYLAQVLANTPVMKRKEVQDWLKTLELEAGQELLQAVNANNADPEIIADILKNPNIDINYKGNNGRTALMQASLKGQTEIVKLLLIAGANVNVQDVNGRTALILMLWQRSSIEIAQLLISAGANLNIKLSKGMTIYIQQPDGTQTMVKAEDSPAAFVAGSTALMIAAEDGRLDVVRLLLAAGADPLIRNTIGRSAANYALKRYWTGGGHEYEEIGKLLTEAEKVQREKAQIKEQKEKEARKAAKKAQNEKAMRK